MVGKYAVVSFSNESRNEVPDFWIKEEMGKYYCYWSEFASNVSWYIKNRQKPNDKWEKWEVSDVKYYGNFLSFTYIYIDSKGIRI